MRQILILASLALAHPVGVREHAWGLTSKVSKTDIEVTNEVGQYVQPMVEMLELAEEMAMSKPENVLWNVAQKFADGWCKFIKGEHAFPEREVCIQQLAQYVGQAFSDSLSHTQRDALAKKLKDFD